MCTHRDGLGNELVFLFVGFAIAQTLLEVQNNISQDVVLYNVFGIYAFMQSALEMLSIGPQSRALAQSSQQF